MVYLAKLQVKENLIQCLSLNASHYSQTRREQRGRTTIEQFIQMEQAK